MSFPDSTTTQLTREHTLYPRELDDLGAGAPQLLWARGALETLTVRPRVAIVGTRRATPYGRRVTHEIATALARAGACVVSGMAIGIDGYAHRAALEGGGATIAVLGTGLDVVFPRANRDLQDSITKHGLVLTELEPHFHGAKWNFPQRNRIIAALAEVTIVVEAGIPSGALNTASHALELSRKVAGVPGPIDQPQSAGVNRLIRDGAVLLASVEDALALAGLTPPPRVPRAHPSADEGRIWAALANGPLDIDTLCHRSGLPAARCMVAITKLEMAGSIECALSGEISRR